MTKPYKSGGILACQKDLKEIAVKLIKIMNK
jgi:hypothetical protein